MFLKRLLLSFNTHVESLGTPYIAIGCYEVINYFSMLPWWFWVHHGFAGMHFLHIYFFVPMGFLLIFHKFWPQKLSIFKPLYLYICLFFMFPYITFYYYFENPTSLFVIPDTMLAIFILILTVDWISFVTLMSVGMLAAFITHLLQSNSLPNLTIQQISINFFNFCWSIFTGALFSRNASRRRLNIQLEKQLAAVKTVVASIAHELRTPLLSIRAGAAGIQAMVPKLAKGYRLAKKAKMEVEPISEQRLEHLDRVIDIIDSEVTYSNSVIDALLINANQQKIIKDTFHSYSAINCVNAAMGRYPFNPSEQIHLINIDSENNFYFHGDDLLVTHIIFNLLKNALYAIAEVDKGEIYISFNTDDKKYNRLLFKDTSKGMSQKVREKVFDAFYSNTPNNTGMGLAFCRLAMESFGGRIDVDSVEGEYTRFILEFPKVNK